MYNNINVMIYMIYLFVVLGESIYTNMCSFHVCKWYDANVFFPGDVKMGFSYDCF